MLPFRTVTHINTRTTRLPNITFIANRASNKGNILFPDKITIDDDNLTFYKGQLIGYKKTIVQRVNVCSVSIHENILFGDILVETKGGVNIIACGFLKSEAKQIIEILT